MVYQTKLTPIRCYICLFGIFASFALLASSFFDVITEVSMQANVPNPQDNQGPFPSDKARNLHWFVQVSDIHFSVFYDDKRAPDFKAFLQKHLIEIIKPEVVLVTGDLTDAKARNLIGSQQYEQEWKMYDSVIKETDILNKTVWLDIRGNHDVFSVVDKDSPNNFYRKYSPQGRNHFRHYMYKHKTTDGNEYSFIAVDSSPQPGPKRPFNFFGVLHEQDMVTLQGFREESKSSNKTIWFGHYPTSMIYSPFPGLRSILSAGAMYLCGHLHTMNNFVPRMQAKMREGYLEMEVGDWKDYRKFRVFAIDHDLFSFTDVTFGDLPIILITNPKNALFNQPNFEPTGRMLRSTHIRILVFSLERVTTVFISIDGRDLGYADNSQGPLFTIPWEPQKYKHGVHTISVSVEDGSNKMRSIKQKFSLDNTKLSFDFIPRFLLMFNHIFMLRVLFLFAVLATTVPLLLLRIINIQVETGFNGQSCKGCFSRFVQSWIRRLYNLANTDRLFYPLVGYVAYICIGPWFIGEVIAGQIGAMFVFGIYVDGSFIPGSFTYFYGFVQLLLFNFPLTLYLSQVLDLTLSQNKQQSATSQRPLHRTLLFFEQHIVFMILVLYQCYLAYSDFYRAYGFMAFLICPVRTWSIPFIFYLRKIAIRQHTRDERLRDAAIQPPYNGDFQLDHSI